MLKSSPPSIINVELNLKEESSIRLELLIELCKLPSIGLKAIRGIYSVFPKDDALYEKLCLAIWNRSRLLSKQLGIFEKGRAIRETLDNQDFDQFCDIIKNSKMSELEFIIKEGNSVEYCTFLWGTNIDTYLFRLWNTFMADPNTQLLKKKTTLLSHMKKKNYMISRLCSSTKVASSSGKVNLSSGIREEALVNTKLWNSIVSFSGAGAPETIISVKGAKFPITKAMVENQRKEQYYVPVYKSLESLIMPDKSISPSSDLPPTFLLSKIEVLKTMPIGTAIGPFENSHLGIFKQGDNLYVPFYAYWDQNEKAYTEINLYSGHIFFSIKDIRKLFRRFWVKTRENYLSDLSSGYFNEIFTNKKEKSYIRKTHMINKSSINTRHNSLDEDCFSYSESKSYGFPCFLAMAQEKRMMEIIKDYMVRLHVALPPVGELFLKPNADATLCIG